ncbi:unnamed protein product [Prorocentrum cordatum]|uniref:Uncharacterized protein n=1 Tax=Prorocentrum cordatum TaxID=2364126 RepID=A0ABN9PTU4_9DINO|nr:unnamed protein product [Polarella glacialis]
MIVPAGATQDRPGPGAGAPPPASRPRRLRERTRTTTRRRMKERERERESAEGKMAMRAEGSVRGSLHSAAGRRGGMGGGGEERGGETSREEGGSMRLGSRDETCRELSSPSLSTLWRNDLPPSRTLGFRGAGCRLLCSAGPEEEPRGRPEPRARCSKRLASPPRRSGESPLQLAPPAMASARPGAAAGAGAGPLA